jgi:hypothetical protein
MCDIRRLKPDSTSIYPTAFAYELYIEIAGSTTDPTTAFSNALQSDVLDNVIAVASNTSSVRWVIGGKSSMFVAKYNLYPTDSSDVSSSAPLISRDLHPNLCTIVEKGSHLSLADESHTFDRGTKCNCEDGGCIRHSILDAIVTDFFDTMRDENAAVNLIAIPNIVTSSNNLVFGKHRLSADIIPQITLWLNR